MAAISKPKNLAEALEAKTKTMASAKKELAKVIDSEKEDDEENDDAYWFSSIESEKEDEYGDYGDEDYYDEYGNEALQKKNETASQKKNKNNFLVLKKTKRNSMRQLLTW